MSTPHDLEGRLRADLTDSVSDVHVDSATADLLIRTAMAGEPVRRRHRVWIAPMLAAAAVVVVIVVTSAVVAESDDADHPAPPVTSLTTTTTAPVSTPTPTPTTSTPTTPSNSTSKSAPTSTSKSVPPPASNTVLGPDGLGALKLGMTREQAMATGVLAEIEPLHGGTCALIHLAGHPITVNSGDGYLSAKYGIVLIVPGSDVKTPEGIVIGSPIADVERAYPGTVYNFTTRMDAGPRVPVPGDPNAYYTFPDSGTGKVTAITIQRKTQDCFN